MTKRDHDTGQGSGSLEDGLWRLASEYLFLPSDTSRASARAHQLHLLERQPLPRPARITTQRVTAARMRALPPLLGAIRMQLDLAFRASFSPEQILEIAARGIVRIAVHPALAGFPIGVQLALPHGQLPANRAELFEAHDPAAGATFMVLLAVAANPTRMGAGAALLHAAHQDCRELPSRPTLVAFSPLTGLRAAVIRAIDETLPRGTLRDQLRFLLRSRATPPQLPAEARTWLLREARELAVSTDYFAGNFHRATGGELLGVAECADVDDCDSMWMRAYFAYTNG